MFAIIGMVVVCVCIAGGNLMQHGNFASTCATGGTCFSLRARCNRDFPDADPPHMI